MNPVSKLKTSFSSVFLIALILGAGYVWWTWTSSVKATSDRALSTASAMAGAMNGEMLQQVQVVPEDIGTFPYESIKTRLVSLRNIDASVRFLYIYTQREGKIYFVADSEDPSSSDYSPPGQEYTEADSSVYVPFSGKSLITAPSTDRWGTWVSALVPIKNSKTGQVAFVFGMDYPAENWNKKAIADSVQASLVVFLAFLLIGSFYVLFKKNLKLKESEEKYRLIFDQAPIGIYTINKDGLIDSFNPKMVDISGVKSANEVIDLNVFSLDSYKKSGLDKFFREGLNGKYFTTEVKYFSQIGQKESWRHYRGVPVFLPDSKTVDKLLLLVEDITKTKEIDKAKTEFVSTVSHELRTPLAIVLEGVSLVLDEIVGKINKKQKDTLLIAKNNLLRLASIINGVLDIAKIEAGKMEINKTLIDIGELIKKTTDIFSFKANKKGLQLRIVLPKRIHIYADPEIISQVLINLIGNSMKFTSAGYIEVGVTESANEIQCYVSDTGMGIAKKNLPLAFDKFQQFERQMGPGEKGTGLGLPICKAYIIAHQGKIWIESEEGKGTKVIFTLPKRSIDKNKK